ncbi:type IV secretory pathway TraG/TraD family ATPase VirD4 [Thermoanaerobacterium thermosaccharolyticum]|nr:type IV secretory pathway TraG/TraD family ATPase VirD4 [Thermoanaerobacterium thermosaccharolyticum]
MFDCGDVSTSTQKRALLNIDEILRLEHMSALLILREQKLFKVKKSTIQSTSYQNTYIKFQ